MRVETKELKQKVRVEIEGEATIQNIEKIHAEFLEAVKPEKNLEISTSGITRTDVSFLQLLYGLYLSQKNKGKKLSFSEDPLPSVLTKAVEDTGFFRSAGVAGSKTMDEGDPFRRIMH
jgi:ABC-type transporter Mla MlaB component